MAEPITIDVTTLTPLWTGGVDTGKMDRIHETSLLGSLRWWYEAIIRGLGGDVCDPTSEGSDADRCPRSDKSYCDVCQLFGATGRGRRFRLRLEDGQPLYSGTPDPLALPSGRVHRSRDGSWRAGGWFLQGQARTGSNLQLRVVPMASDDIALLRVPLLLILRHAALGAKVSNGYGVLTVAANDSAVNLSRDLMNCLPSRNSRRGSILPDLRDFFFGKVRFQEPPKRDWWQQIKGIQEAWSGEVQASVGSIGVFDSGKPQRNIERRDAARARLSAVMSNGMLPLSPAVRNWMRFHWFPALFESGHAPRELEQNLFGRVGRRSDDEDNLGSRIEVSHAYKVGHGLWEFRIWGWIPCVLPAGLRLDRRRFLSDLHTGLNDSRTWQWVMGDSTVAAQVAEWHALECDDLDGRSFLEELLGIGPGGSS